MSLTVLAIDPGKDNCGLAVVRFGDDLSEEIILMQICPTPELEHILDRMRADYRIDRTAVGSGTFCESIVDSVTKCGLPNIRVVDEKNTTLEARARYIDANPPPWYLRWIPRSLLLPSSHCDDWAAVILAERAIKHESEHDTLF